MPPAAATGEALRLSKRMAELGLCSRREADDYIVRGWVRVDGVPVDQLGSKVTRDQHVELDPRAQRSQQGLATILLHKPVGFVSTQPEDGYRPAVDLVTPERCDPRHAGPPLQPQHLRGLAVAGRLDIDSTGLLVLTQDGRIARQLVGEDRAVDKEYLVRVRGQLSREGLGLLRHGLALDGEPLLPAEVEWVNADQLRFVLREGKKRQIRRMCTAVGLDVTGLKRVRIGEVRLGNLQLGMWRWLRPDEQFVR
jgi:23S rRNA pseudouridine2604 synthase